MNVMGILAGIAGVLLVAGIAVAAVVGFVISLYNKLVALQARYKNSFSQIEVQLMRRYDLIPNIVETAKAYMKHESETLTNVINARNGAMQSLKEAAADPSKASAIKSLNTAESKLGGLMGGLRVQFEAYPELKASQVMMQLSEELSTTENRVAFARQAFNDAATEYNIKRNSFPANIVAGMLGHREDAELLAFSEENEAIKHAPKVQF